MSENPPPSPGPREEFEKRVLSDAPRLKRGDRFRFACHPGVPCFGECCGDVNIVLTPYDVLRLKRRLGLTSNEFLERYTILPFTKDQRIPAPLLRMGEDEKKRCPFLTGKGCSVYEDRPWACRMFPLGHAMPGKGETGEEFFFLVEEKGCRGFDEPREFTVAEWLESQGLAPYTEWGERYRELAVDEFLSKGRDLEPRQMEMFFMGTYELDRFRRFVFGSTFLTRFTVPPDLVEKIRADDEELLRFAFKWLLFSLFGKRTEDIMPGAGREQKA